MQLHRVQSEADLPSHDSASTISAAVNEVVMTVIAHRGRTRRIRLMAREWHDGHRASDGFGCRWLFSLLEARCLLGWQVVGCRGSRV